MFILNVYQNVKIKIMFVFCKFNENGITQLKISVLITLLIIRIYIF